MDKMIKGKTWILKIVGCTYEFLMVLVGHVVFQCPICKIILSSTKEVVKDGKKGCKACWYFGGLHSYRNFYKSQLP